MLGLPTGVAGDRCAILAFSPAVSSGSASAIRSITSPHSPSFLCPKNLIVGYHDVSSRPVSHRQSLASGIATHTGTPSAPARCAKLVSTAITRSRFFITAAVSSR